MPQSLALRHSHQGTRSEGHLALRALARRYRQDGGAGHDRRPRVAATPSQRRPNRGTLGLLGYACLAVAPTPTHSLGGTADVSDTAGGARLPLPDQEALTTLVPRAIAEGGADVEELMARVRVVAFRYCRARLATYGRGISARRRRGPRRSASPFLRGCPRTRSAAAPLRRLGLLDRCLQGGRRAAAAAPGPLAVGGRAARGAGCVADTGGVSHHRFRRRPGRPADGEPASAPA